MSIKVILNNEELKTECTGYHHNHIPEIKRHRNEIYYSFSDL